jgi:hypothetical protein
LTLAGFCGTVGEGRREGLAQVFGVLLFVLVLGLLVYELLVHRGICRLIDNYMIYLCYMRIILGVVGEKYKKG